MHHRSQGRSGSHPPPPTLVLPIAMQPRVKVAPPGAGNAPGREPGHAAALSESGPAARMKRIEEAEDVPENDYAVSAFGALAMSVIGLFAWPLIAGVAALCMGVWALSEMRVTGNHGGRKTALLGIVLGLINVGFWVFFAMARVSESLAT